MTKGGIHIKQIIIFIFLVLVLTGCSDSVPSQKVDAISDSQAESVTSVDTANTELVVDDHNVRFLCAWQNRSYIDDGRIAPHYMIYYVKSNGTSYSAFWETIDESPKMAIAHFEDFTNVIELDTIDDTKIGNIYDHFLCISNQGLDTVKLEGEELDISIPNEWWYGYVGGMADETRQVCFYQYYNGNRQQIDEAETRLIINELYDTSSFLEARNIWYTKYVNSTGVY